MSTPTERDNRMSWDGTPGHYEVWYTTLSHRRSGAGFWIRYTITAPTGGQGDPCVALWFARFDAARPEATFGVHRRMPRSSLRTSAGEAPFSVSIGEAEMRHDGLRGAIAGDGHEARWDLTWTPAETTHLHLPQLLYRGALTDTKVLSPNLAVPTRGTITVDGEEYSFDGEPAGQSHVWGRKHAYQWAWSHCADFDGAQGTAFESVSARIRRGAVVLPTMTVFTLYHEGEKLDFREPWRIPFSRAQFATGRYHVVGASATARVEAELTASASDTLLSEYVDPDGDPAFCHNTCIGDATITIRRRSPFVGRWRDAGRLVARRTAHWEWGARAGDAANVKRRHVEVP